MWEDDENFSDEDYNKEQERVENLPIVKKANELFELVNALIETFDIKDKEGEENIPFADEVDEQNTDFDEEDEDDFEEEDAEELDEEDLKSFG